MTLNLLLKQLNITQTNLAKRMHLSQSTISLWVLGKCYPRFDKMQELAKVLNVNLQTIVNCFSDRKEKDQQKLAQKLIKGQLKMTKQILGLDRLDLIEIQQARLNGKYDSLSMLLLDLKNQISDRKLIIESFLLFLSEKIVNTLNEKQINENLNNLLNTYKVVTELKDEFINKKTAEQTQSSGGTTSTNL